MATPASDPVTNFLTRFGLRDVGHFVSVFAAVFFTTINLSSVNAARASALAAVGAAATVTFRQVFPHQTPPAQQVVAVVQAAPGNTLVGATVELPAVRPPTPGA